MDDMVKTTHARHGESLEEVCQHFKRWREGRGRGEHIPRELWAVAIAIAREQGLHVAAARALQGDSDRSKRRQQEREVAHCEWAIEFEKVRGAKMRVKRNGQGLASLAGLGSALWSAA